MLHYIIQTIAFQLFFLLVYDVFLKKETFFNWNRMYLLSTAVLSLILPFIKIDSFKQVVPQDYIVSLPEIMLGQSSENLNNTVVLDAVILENNPLSFWEILFYVGVIVAFCLFLIKVIKILILVIKNPKQSIGKVVLVELLNSTAAFSFFHYIFLGEHIKTEDKDTILKHELIHTEQKHTIDLLFFEVLRIVFWFNPFVYMYQNRLATLHEFIADANALKYQDKEQYYQNLLAQVFETKNISFINTFFKQSLIKKRIVMLSKTKSKQVNLFKYVLLIPMVVGMLVYTSAEAQDESNKTSQSTSEFQDLNVKQLKYLYRDELQDLNDKQLKKKYRDELLEMEKNGASSSEISKTYISSNTDFMYVLQRVNYYRQQAFFKYMADKSETSEINPSGALNRSYNDYLDWKKTDEAKEIWENNTHDGMLRLVVNDLKNLTAEENLKFEKKKKLLEEDVFFTQLMLTDVKGSVANMEFRPNEYSSANTQDESKAARLNKVGINVGYNVIDRAPAFPGCEDLPNNELKKCTKEKINKHISRKFNTDLAGDLGLTGRQRIHTVFKINENGDIVDIKSKGPHPGLEAEAIRVIKTLPKMIPGEHKGEKVTVSYAVPIIFQVADDVKTKEPELIPLNEANVDVPFSVIDQVPIFPGCENLTKEEQRKCISNNIKKHVNRNFNTGLADSLGLKGRQRINVIFKIDTLGNIVGVRSRAPHPELEKEAARVINELPKMIPGKQRGRAVTVPYSLPIIFQVHDDDVEPKEIEARVYDIQKDEANIDVPFSVIENVPVYPGCEDLETNAEKKDCMSKNISEFIAKNFNVKVANENGLSGRQRINVIFKINSEGNVTGIRSRAAHPELEKEAARVISLLPKMKPGVQRGKVVTVPYSLPIIFDVPEKTEMLDEVAVVGYADDRIGGSLPYAIVDKAPILPECKSLETEEEKRKCTSYEISKFVNKNFNTDLPSQLGLKGQQRINVIFKITKKGKIEIEKSRASHPDIEAEAIRVIKSIPKLIPGKHKGKKVDVLYSLPIVFQVQK